MTTKKTKEAPEPPERQFRVMRRPVTFSQIAAGDQVYGLDCHGHVFRYDDAAECWIQLNPIESFAEITEG